MSRNIVCRVSTIGRRVLMIVLAAGTTAHADVWDTQTVNDDTPATHNELTHGSDQMHDLAARPGPSLDEDWYALFYRVRFYETTYSVPRFNNSATQVTVLVLQNPADYAIAGTVHFWSSAGAQLGAGSAFSLDSKQTLVLSTSAVPGVAGQSGSITIAHNGRYGDLSGKAVALEPSTGFSFDSPMVPRGN